MTNTPTRILALALLSAATALPAFPAVAKGADVVARGACGSGTHWKLKAGGEDGRIEVEAEIDSNRVGQTWRWRLRHDGTLSARGTATTKAPSGSFTVRRTVVNLAGRDRLVFRAHNPRTGATCRGVVNF